MNQIDDKRDNLRKQAEGDLARKVLTREVDGVALSLEVDPCSWMYLGYGLQASVTMAGGGNATLSDKGIAFKDATLEDLQRMLDQVGIVVCKTCGKPAFDPATVSTNRAGECEMCFMAKLNASFQKSVEKEKKRMAKLDVKYKALGYTHRVDAWIHPAGEGDDQQVSFYVQGAPSKELIQGKLKKSRSSVLDDYTVVTL